MSNWEIAVLVAEYLIKILAVGLVPDGRKPGSANAWLLLILFLPAVGLPLYLLMGSNYVDRRRHQRQKRANDSISEVFDYWENPSVGPEVDSIMRQNRTLTHIPALGSTVEGFHPGYEESIDAMARAIDTADKYVYVEIYTIAWDETTDPFFKALARATARGVTVKLLFDHIGTFKYPKYLKLGERLDSIGVDWRPMLPLQPFKWRFRRPDLRNHRKLVVVDNQVAFMGSQNMIERSYRTAFQRHSDRAWVDAMVELTGPIVSTLTMVFAIDWYSETEEIVEYTEHQIPAGEDVMQLVPSGPGITADPNLRLFNSVVHSAKERVVLCSPYFIPDTSLLDAVTSAAYRGVRVQLLVNEKADQFMVHHTQCSYYQNLLDAGIEIYQYPMPYVLHTKYVLVDPGSADAEALTPGAAAGSTPTGSATAGSTPTTCVFGSSNMDMRSFGLNYEVSLFATGQLCTDLERLTDEYLSVSKQLTQEEWSTRSFPRRWLDNALRLTSALQ